MWMRVSYGYTVAAQDPEHGVIGSAVAGDVDTVCIF
jgi:hypothetical protein